MTHPWRIGRESSARQPLPCAGFVLLRGTGVRRTAPLIGQGNALDHAGRREFHLELEAIAFTTNPRRASSDGPVSDRFVEALERGAKSAGLPAEYIASLRASAK